MKALDNIALYDAYLSAKIVNYTNNTWKNNICFYPDKVNNALLKSKGGDDYLIRNYSNNTFIVEESFAERVGQSKENLYVYFISLTAHADSYTISDNVIDVYELRLPTSSLLINNLYINNNIIKAKIGSGYLGIIRLNDKYATETVEITNNTIEINESIDSAVSLFRVVDSRKNSSDIVDNLIVNNNTITAPLGYLFYEVIADNFEFNSNKVNDTGEDYSGFAYSGKLYETNIAGNTIESRSSMAFYEGRQFYGEGIKSEELVIISKISGNTNNGMQLDTAYNADIPTLYERTYNIVSEKGNVSFKFEFILSYNSNTGHAEVTFEDSSGKTNTYRLSADSTISDGNGKKVKLINVDNKSELSYEVKFFNAKGIAGFYIDTPTDSVSQILVKTVSQS